MKINIACTRQINPEGQIIMWSLTNPQSIHSWDFLKKPIHSGLIFCTYGTGRPVHYGLDWPYKVIRDRKFCFWKSLFILNWSDLIWAWYTQSRSLEAVSTASIRPGGTLHTYIFWTYRTDKTCSFWTEMAIYGHEVTFSFW